MFQFIFSSMANTLFTNAYCKEYPLICQEIFRKGKMMSVFTDTIQMIHYIYQSYLEITHLTITIYYCLLMEVI